MYGKVFDWVKGGFGKVVFYLSLAVTGFVSAADLLAQEASTVSVTPPNIDWGTTAADLIGSLTTVAVGFCTETEVREWVARSGEPFTDKILDPSDPSGFKVDAYSNSPYALSSGFILQRPLPNGGQESVTFDILVTLQYPNVGGYFSPSQITVSSVQGYYNVDGVDYFVTDYDVDSVTFEMPEGSGSFDPFYTQLVVRGTMPVPNFSNDLENDCTCGACCSCKCTCGNWSAVTCSGTCWHFGHGDASMPPEVAGHYCECHHQDDGGDDGENEPCCEHHAAIQAATERTATASESIDDKLDEIENELSGINDKLTVTDPGHLTLPPLGGGVDVPLPSIPSVSAPSLSLPEIGEVSEHPLTYFQRKSFGELPSFSYDILYEELSSKVEDKFGLQSLSDKFQNPAAGNFDLSFTIDFQLPEPFNVHVGPHKFDIGKYINDYAALPIANIIRLILLAYFGLHFIIVTVNIVFLTPF